MAAERTVRAVPREHVAGLSERERCNTSTERAARSDAWFCYKFIQEFHRPMGHTQLLSSQARDKMFKELLKRNKQNLNVRPSGARCMTSDIQEWT